MGWWVHASNHINRHQICREVWHLWHHLHRWCRILICRVISKALHNKRSDLVEHAWFGIKVVQRIAICPFERLEKINASTDLRTGLPRNIAWILIIPCNPNLDTLLIVIICLIGGVNLMGNRVYDSKYHAWVNLAINLNLDELSLLTFEAHNKIKLHYIHRYIVPKVNIAMGVS